MPRFGQRRPFTEHEVQGLPSSTGGPQRGEGLFDPARPSQGFRSGLVELGDAVVAVGVLAPRPEEGEPSPTAHQAVEEVECAACQAEIGHAVDGSSRCGEQSGQPYRDDLRGQRSPGARWSVSPGFRCTRISSA